MTLPTLDIIIVNWNAGDQLRSCLQSIRSASHTGFALQRVILVDNASSDGSIASGENVDLPLDIVRNPSNVGFGAACNQALEGLDSDYVLFLNPDVILQNNSLDGPIAAMETKLQDRYGICGIQLLGDGDRVSRTCARFPTPGMFVNNMLGLDRLAPGLFKSHVMTDWDHAGNHLVDHVMGAFYLVRTSLVRQLGGFDERFFVYLEDLDFSLRAAQAGWRSYYLADVCAFHKGGGTSDQIKGQRMFYSLRSRILYGFKHFGRVRATGLLAGTLVLEPLVRLVGAIVRLSWRTVGEILKGYVLLYRAIPRILRTARDS